MRILILASDLPFPPIGGGQLRNFHLLRSLATRHEPTLVGFTWGTTVPTPPFPARVIGVPWDWPELYKQMKSGDADASRSAFEALSGEDEEPWFVSCYRSEAMQETLVGLAGERFDTVVIENAMMARFLPWLPADAPKVLDLHDVHSLIARRAVEGLAGEERDREVREAGRIVRYERRVAAGCRLCLAVSRSEAASARALLEIDRVQVVPNGVDAAHFTPEEGRAEGSSLLFTGLMNYAPNVEAVRWFAAEILPIVVREIPGARLGVVGDKPADEVRALASDRIAVHGFVPDTRPY